MWPCLGRKKGDIMATIIFRSKIAEHIKSFIELRKASGRQGNYDVGMMRQFDQFIMGKLKPGQPLTKDLLERYIQDIAHLNPGTRMNRLSVIRQFCIHLRYFDDRTYIIPWKLLSRRPRFLPYIFTPEEITAIMAAAKRIGPAKSIRPIAIYTFVGLLASTGLRISEALKLTLADVDIRNGLLIVNKTKFQKSRNVPLSKSTTHQLAAYLKKRKKAGFSMLDDSPLFVNLQGNRYSLTAIRTIIKSIMGKLGIFGQKGKNTPRIHDFRHTFAVSRLLEWYRHGDNLMAKLPLLSTYLGHSTVTSTEVYLHSTSELMEQVHERFHDKCAIPNVKKENDDENGN